MPKVRSDLSGIKGLGPRFYGNKDDNNSFNNQEAIYGIDGQYGDGVCNPAANLGFLSPASNTFTNYKATTGSAGFQDVFINGVVDGLNDAIYFLNTNARVYEVQDLTTDMTGTTDADDFVDRITTTSAVGTDAILYTLNGVQKYYWTYRDTSGGQGDMGVANLPQLASSTAVFLSVQPVNAFTLSNSNHRLIVADNGFMYILDGSSLHKFDGTTNGGASGTVTANVLSFPAFFQLVDAVDIRGRMWIGVNRTTRNLRSTVASPSYNEFAGVYIWDRQSGIVNMTDFIPIDGVKEVRIMFSFHGIPHCFTVSSEGLTQIRKFTGNEFEIQKELGRNAHPRLPGSISIEGDTVTWLGEDGFFYTYGKADSQTENALYKIGKTTSASTYCGAILKVVEPGGDPDDGFYYFSYRHASSTAYSIWFPYGDDDAKARTSAVTDTIYYPQIGLPKLSQVTDVTMYMKQLSGTGATIHGYLDVYFNLESTTSVTIPITRTDMGRGYIYQPIGASNAGSNFMEFAIRYDGNAPNFSQPFMPMFTEIDYEQRGKKK